MPKKPHVHIAAEVAAGSRGEAMGMGQLLSVQGEAAMMQVLPAPWSGDRGGFRSYCLPV